MKIQKKEVYIHQISFNLTISNYQNPVSFRFVNRKFLYNQELDTCFK